MLPKLSSTVAEKEMMVERMVYGFTQEPLSINCDIEGD